MKQKDIKAITMVRNDRFLQKWVDYYGSQLGRENLYVYFDGEDQEVPDFCKDINTTLVPKMQGDVVSTERQRSRFISERAAELFAAGADMVIANGSDVRVIHRIMEGRNYGTIFKANKDEKFNFTDFIDNLHR